MPLCVKGGLQLVGRLFAHLGGNVRSAGDLLRRCHAGEEACIIRRGRRKSVRSEIGERREGSEVAIAAAEGQIACFVQKQKSLHIVFL